MDDREREQIGLIVTHEVALIYRVIETQVAAIFGEHAAKGRLQSGATIKVSVAAMQETAESFLSDVALKVKQVSTGPEAFKFLREAVFDCLNACSAKMPEIIRMAKGGTTSGHDSIDLAAMKLFAELRSDVESKLEIQRFDFERASVPEPAANLAVAPRANPGGSPRAAFWDDLWAAMAAALYDGSLAPKTQADVERAMADWLEGRGHSAADSTIRARARRLWDAIDVSGE